MKIITSVTIKKAVELAKPFVMNLRTKTCSRPILRRALVTNEYVIATDSHCLIKIKHNEDVQETYLHEYKEDDNDLSVSSYPNIDRLIPHPLNAKHSFKLDVNEGINVHKLALIAAKEHKNKVVSLEKNLISVKSFVDITEFNQIAFTHELEHDTEVDKISYNCEYMLKVLNVFKKLKEKEVTCYFYGALRPMLFVSNDVEIIMLPVRTN